MEAKQEKGHIRTKSGAKASRPRSSTKGPLDLNDPLSPISPSTAQRLVPAQSRSSSGRSTPSNAPTRDIPIRQMNPQGLQKDFSFLLKPEIYHPLTSLNVPQSFRVSSKQPTADTPLVELCSRGHFRAAAITAVQELTSSSRNVPPIDPYDYNRIFDLLYTRLACLTLIDAAPLAAQEVKAFEDINSVSMYVDEITGEHLVPWHLRVLIIRLQAIGFGDWRRAVMAYHDLAREARANVARAIERHDNSASELWRSRLSDVGLSVAGALVEMDDLSGAAHHLNTLKSNGNGRIAMSRALLWLHVGDAEAAKTAVEDLGPGAAELQQVVDALADMVNGDFAAALERWNALTGSEWDEMISTNRAVCLLYTGRMSEARNALEELIRRGFNSHTLLSNLGTTYELCTDHSRSLKLGLAETVSQIDEGSHGWEKLNGDFKL